MRISYITSIFAQNIKKNCIVKGVRTFKSHKNISNVAIFNIITKSPLVCNNEIVEASSRSFKYYLGSYATTCSLL